MLAAASLACLLASAGAPSSSTTPTTTTSTTTPSATAAVSAKAAPPSDSPHLDLDDPRNGALLVLTAGTLSSVASATAFVVGFDAERELRASTHDEASADALLNKRTIAGWVAWPSALVGVAGVSTGVVLLALHHDTPDETHSPPSPPTSAATTPTTTTTTTPTTTTTQTQTTPAGEGGAR